MNNVHVNVKGDKNTLTNEWPMMYSSMLKVNVDSYRHGGHDAVARKAADWHGGKSRMSPADESILQAYQVDETLKCLGA